VTVGFVRLEISELPAISIDEPFNDKVGCAPIQMLSRSESCLCHQISPQYVSAYFSFAESAHFEDTIGQFLPLMLRVSFF
jgi:hypothetical protein